MKIGWHAVDVCDGMELIEMKVDVIIDTLVHTGSRRQSHSGDRQERSRFKDVPDLETLCRMQIFIHNNIESSNW